VKTTSKHWIHASISPGRFVEMMILGGPHSWEVPTMIVSSRPSAMLKLEKRHCQSHVDLWLTTLVSVSKVWGSNI
jgi:hypothetical protein